MRRKYECDSVKGSKAKTESNTILFDISAQSGMQREGGVKQVEIVSSSLKIQYLCVEEAG